MLTYQKHRSPHHAKHFNKRHNPPAAGTDCPGIPGGRLEELRSEVLPTSLYVDGQVRYTRLAR